MEEQNSIRCMQLPLVDWQLLLPNSAVAEIIGYVEPESAAAQGWFQGSISWRGVDVPVISMEQLCGQTAIEPGSRSRIAIVYNPLGDQAMPYLGIVLQDIPRAYLAEQDRMQEAVDVPGCQYLMTRADMMQDKLVIPDLDAIMSVVKQRVSH